VFVPDITNVADAADTLDAFVAIKLDARPLKVSVDVPRFRVTPAPDAVVNIPIIAGHVTLKFEVLKVG